MHFFMSYTYIHRKNKLEMKHRWEKVYVDLKWNDPIPYIVQHANKISLRYITTCIPDIKIQED